MSNNLSGSFGGLFCSFPDMLLDTVFGVSGHGGVEKTSAPRISSFVFHHSGIENTSAPRIYIFLFYTAELKHKVALRLCTFVFLFCRVLKQNERAWNFFFSIFFCTPVEQEKNKHVQKFFFFCFLQVSGVGK